MWLQTKFGFYSVVEHRDDVHTVLIRARARKDLENLCDLADSVRRDYSTGDALGIDRSAIQYTPDADYHYRLLCPRQSWMEVSLRLMTEIDYGNFKDAVAERDQERAWLYHRVWTTLYSIQSKVDLWGRRDSEDAAVYYEDDDLDPDDPDSEEAVLRKFLDECGDPR